MSLTPAQSAFRSLPLPEGIAAVDFWAAIDEFVIALSSAAVHSNAEDVDIFEDPHALPSERPASFSAVVWPSSAEQVREVVIIANRYKIPLWPYAGGHNNGYGALTPRVRGSVMVNLCRMNRVLEINTEHAYAVIEPGVSFFDLYEHLRAGGYPLMMSVPELASGSVIADTLEYGLGQTVPGDHTAYQCGIEAVLADGTLVRTGMGAMPDNRAWHVDKASSGPAIDGLFLRSNLGIVTRMAVWLMPRPQRYLSCSVRCEHDSDLGAIVDVVRPFLLDGTISNNPVITNLVSTAAMYAGHNEWYANGGPIPEPELERIVRETGMGRWNLRFALYGRDAIVEAHLSALRAAFNCISDAQFSYREYDGGAPEASIHSADKTQAGIPGSDFERIATWIGAQNGGYITFSPVAPLGAQDVNAQYRLLRQGLEELGFDHCGALVLLPRSAIHVCHLLFDTGQPDQVIAAYAACETMLQRCAAAGYGIHRAHTAFMDQIAEHYSFNDHALPGLHGRIKDALDPHGVLAPGKHGVWPGRRER